ncbi:MAG TPA: hypothetical protein PLE99_03875 [Candidatus Thiothrix moscowensis]|uniref:hypothetical protein n=1 Tax=unclassified Thiothrix TaxID=2636184 RepID=UPI0025F98CDF|nr:MULTISPECIES: hypothetical protein [unclassified Thiothrix]HRJ51885.1 hypothetical protein [Candidatus Thiothrix moscowensis]HRJ92200.1 hypothetical protein [Candidatus Thiothrix moscowensis]
MVRWLLLMNLVTILAGCAQTPPASTVSSNTSTNVCMQQVQDLQRIPPAPTSPTDGFRRNQLCIAERVCRQRAEFTDPRWLDQVMQDFITAYTRKTLHWEQLLANCQQRSPLNPLRKLLCQREMARYHIFTDLRAALDQAGCGTDADWQRLEGHITACIADAGYAPLLSDYIQHRVVNYRNQVRWACQHHQ